MTDGVQEVSGIEYKPMRNLSCDITPGCKVLIKGIFLSNIRFLEIIHQWSRKAKFLKSNK